MWYKRYPIRVAFFYTLIYLVLHLFVMDDYGLSWDFHYHHYAGLYHLGLPVPSINDPPPVPFTPPDPRLTTEDPFGPFTQILPSLSEYFFHQKLNLLSMQNAYNLPIIFFGAAGVFLLFLFLYESVGVVTAFSGMIILSLLPLYIGYLHNDMKDVPNAFAFTLSVYTFWRLVLKSHIKNLAIAVISFAFAFNVKINSIFAPVVCGVWFSAIVLIDLYKRKRFAELRKTYTLPITYFILAPIAAIVLWIPFWNDPFGKLMELPKFYSNNTINMPVLFFGEIVRSGVNIPRMYPYAYLAVTTPLVILIPFVIGLISILFSVITSFPRMRESEISGSRIKSGMTYIFLLCWFFIPLARYMNPQGGAIDGVRHFFEVVYPLAAIAGVGIAIIWNSIKRITYGKYTSVILVVVSCISLMYTNIQFHPYQTSFFNSLIGGIRGAQGKLDIDFWGTPQKDAMEWLNIHAEKDASVHVVMAQSSAAVYARPDILKQLNTKSYEASDYLVILNRESFFHVYPIEPLLKQRIAEGKVVYTKEIEGVPLVWVLRK